MGEHLVLRGTMRAHTDMVTAIAAPIDNGDMIVTASRDKSVILWHLTREDRVYGVPRRRLTGHSHFVQDVALSSDGQFALSGSWDGELRLWDLATGTTARRFVGHTKDVLSVAFSLDNRQIVSASRDKSIRLWNTLGECKYTIQESDAHSDWVSCIRFSPNALQPTIVSASWDKTVKVWNLTNCKLRATLAGHNGYVPDVKPQKKRITLCVEGNISVGKTTFLQRIANETLELRDLVEVVPEPIDKWQNVGRDHFNILDAFYAEPERYAYTFQNYVFVTRVMQERESSGGIKPLRLMERSVFTDRMVFVRAVHEAKWMNEMEISIYDSWFDPVVSSLPGLIPDGFIYLRASPDTCHQRMMIRKREEEGGVSLDYLRDLHEKHESWLLPSESGNHGLLTINQLPLSFDSSLHPAIRDRVFLLEGSHMHPSIQKVPALVLDCEPNIDFTRDIEAKQHYARQVAEFFEFVKKKKLELASPGAQEESGKNRRQPIHPHQTRLWSPDVKNLHDLPFKPLDFGLSMPSFLPG